MEIVISRTVDEIMFGLSPDFYKTPDIPIFSMPEEYKGGKAKYVYYLKKDRLKIFYSDHFKTRYAYLPKGIYPYFNGRIVDNGNERVIRGKFVAPVKFYILSILCLSLFYLNYLGLLFNESDPSRISRYFAYLILAGVIIFIYQFFAIRGKAFMLRNVISNLN